MLALPAMRRLTRGSARVGGDDDAVLKADPTACTMSRGPSQPRTADVAVGCGVGHEHSLGAVGVRPSARHQHEPRAFACRELLQRRRRLERIGARGERRRDVPEVDPQRLVKVAVVGLPARAARPALDSGRPSQRRQLELGRVEGIDRFCLVRSHRGEHEYRLDRRSRSGPAAIPPKSGVLSGQAEPTPARVSESARWVFEPAGSVRG
jgi:hypothetical protein